MKSIGIFELCTVLIFIIQIKSQRLDWVGDKYTHRAKSLGIEELTSFAVQPIRTRTFESFLDPILIPRVPGTSNHAKVKDFIIGEMKNLNWNVETDEFKENTPYGEKPFENIIATLNPDVPRRLVLACHYDSKYVREYNFVGATDSAVPCAMLLDLAFSLNDSLQTHKQHPIHNVTLQFLFFDGEEAFVEWSSSDSIYGSRHLAAKWNDTPYPPGHKRYNELNRIDMLVLLDLIGVKNPSFSNFFQSTSHWHTHLVDIETALRKNRLFTGTRSNNYFKSSESYGGVEDDHVPFLVRGVDILHLISTPFPSVWHKEGDNRKALDFPTIENLNRVIKVFVASYLHLPNSDLSPEQQPTSSGLSSPQQSTSSGLSFQQSTNSYNYNSKWPTTFLLLSSICISYILNLI